MIFGANHVNLSISNIERSFRFYKDVLGFKALCKWPEGAYFLVGDLWFCLNLVRERNPDPTSDYTHRAFSVKLEDFGPMKQRLLEAGALPFKENKSEGDSFCFLDPDGHKLEIHVGDWQGRIAAKKQKPWPGVEFYV